MRRGAPTAATAVAALLLSSACARADAERVRACTSPAQAHELLIQQQFVAPFRALREAIQANLAEAVGVELCRLGEVFVYDVTLLQRDGRVTHALVNARTGALLPPSRPAK